MDSGMLWESADINASTRDLMARLCDVAMEPHISDFTVANMTAIQETQDSRLLALSPELRNIVYEEVLVDTNSIDIPKDGKLIRPPLLKVCRQVAEEASTIFYGLNRFKSTNNRLGDLPLWLVRLPLKLRRNINAIYLCYETDIEADIVAHELHARTSSDKAEERFMSANKKFLDTALQMALSGLDLNAFRLPPRPPIPDSACDVSQTDSAALIRKTREELVSINESAWIRCAGLTILLYSGKTAWRRFQQHRKDEEWLRKVATGTKDENIMASLSRIISVIQG
ncbi:hypothetical protein KC343_g1981 [Hortaea werneckii]|uniref:Uncharacterized protein n=1 Tax=Hortaea werneckii TaxID=91943 RepID=A0A3M7HMG9_HORWE|nr:hypothetical protein KC352_g15216 [Hortaea werneckii]KAI7567780.1 hypothetical protein KC317_g4747 [Hortaea werneckii]KAI7619764.1 hypothetical protein KC346_g4432 [Hortaea werneckii]KAI7635207.1 hypothetical protein KC343_g1981 [Hortaea werneckii]KAI7668167.1 hypothetical protein KC319_g6479 [Hortaea werneckii]